MIKGNFDIPLDFLNTKTPPLCGVDISASSVKIVELSETADKKGYALERYAIESLPKMRSATAISTIWMRYREGVRAPGNEWAHQNVSVVPAAA
jgi:hypothetical protein